MANDVYVQYFNGIPATRNLYDCEVGFRARGHCIVPFEAFEHMPERLKLVTRDNIVCCGIPIFKKVMAHLGVEYRSIDTYPCELQEFLGRNIQLISIRQLLQTYNPQGKPFFIKPKQQKLFSGFEVTGGRGLIAISHLPEGAFVYVSESVRFRSEYRVYIQQNNHYFKNGILGVCHYEGNPLVFPDPQAIHSMLEKYNPFAPAAYALDVGVVQDGNSQKTILVEVNDATSLGNYGLPSPIYAGMLESRWEQLVQK